MKAFVIAATLYFAFAAVVSLVSAGVKLQARTATKTTACDLIIHIAFAVAGACALVSAGGAR